MSQWHIQVAQDNPSSTQGGTFTRDCPFETAAQISRENPDRDVSLQVFARTRMVLRDGCIIREFPALSHFYSNVTDGEARAWAEGLAPPKEEWED